MEKELVATLEGLSLPGARVEIRVDPANDITYENRDRIVVAELDGTGLVALTRTLLPKLIERKGAVINLSSVAATYPYRGGAVYGASKAFVRQFSLDLRCDLAGEAEREK